MSGVFFPVFEKGAVRKFADRSFKIFPDGQRGSPFFLKSSPLHFPQEQLLRRVTPFPRPDSPIPARFPGSGS